DGAGGVSAVAVGARVLPATEAGTGFPLRSHRQKPLSRVRPPRRLPRPHAGSRPPLPRRRSRRGAARGAVVSRRVVVIGGTGAFGARLVDGLLATTDLAVVIAARRAADDLAAALRARYPGRAVEACALDATRIAADDLSRLDAWCVVDAAGPFQGARPRVAEAAIAAGCHYVDI